MIQQQLFQLSELPAGFLFRSDFVTEHEEDQLLDVIRNLKFEEFRMHGVIAKRRIVHFGVRYAFTSHQLSPAPEIPQTFQTIRARAAAIAHLDPAEFSEALVTEYRAGAGIGWHRDAPPFGIVAGISLAENCRMRFQRGRKENRKAASIDLPRRSMYLLTGEVRSEWEHSIPAISNLRYSITFRTVKPAKSALE